MKRNKKRGDSPLDVVQQTCGLPLVGTELDLQMVCDNLNTRPGYFVDFNKLISMINSLPTNPKIAKRLVQAFRSPREVIAFVNALQRLSKDGFRFDGIVIYPRDLV